MKKKFIVLSLILAATIIFSLTGCSNDERGNVKIRLSEVTHSVFYAPQYIAINEGFFEEEGIEIELTNGQGADKVMTAVLSNQVDIGFCGPEAAIYVYNEGKEDHALVFAQLTKRDGSFLVGKSPDNDFKWSNVKGKTIIAGRVGGVPEMTLEYVLKKNNVIPGKDVTLDTSVQFALMAGAFTGGQAEYVTLFEPTASMIEKEGKGYILASVGKDSGEIPYTAYMAKKSYIEKNKDIIQKFTKAIYKGQKWVMSHSPEEIAESLKPSFADIDIELLTTVVERYKDVDAWNSDPILKEEAFNRLQEVMMEAKQLEKTAPYKEVVTTEFAKKAIDDLK